MLVALSKGLLLSFEQRMEPRKKNAPIIAISLIRQS